jgi:hypothetical protein
MKANDKQVGGDHYKVAYQHWDMLVKLGYGPEYYVGQVTKYVTRWRKKNGLRDLVKGTHFAEKLLELVDEFGDKFLPYGGVADGDMEAVVREHLSQHLERYFVDNETGPDEKTIITAVMFANERDMLSAAIKVMRALAATAGADIVDKETPVSRDFEFLGYEDDRIKWCCKKCGEELNLAIDNPPILAHKGQCTAAAGAQARELSDREWAAQPADAREGCTVRVPGVGEL